MSPDQGSGDVSEASQLTRRQYLLSTGGLASGAITVATGSSNAATGHPSLEAGLTAADPTWNTVTLDRPDATPVVVAPALSSHQSTPSSPRLRNVSNETFDVTVEEWVSLDGKHSTESTGYVAADPGQDTLAEDTRFEAGRVRAGHTWTSVSFASSFSAPPVVFSSTQTVNGPSPTITRNRNVSTSSMAVRLQEEEDEGRQRIEEVGYLAIEPGYGTVNGRPIESGIQYDVDDTWQTVRFSGSYRRPVFLADVTSFHGANTAAVRYRNLTESSVEVRIEEERNQNGKTSHFEEAVGYLVVEGAATSGAGFGMGSYGTGMFGR